jgi:cell division protein FtsB
MTASSRYPYLVSSATDRYQMPVAWFSIHRYDFSAMRWKTFWRRPLLTLTQLIVVIAVIIGIFIALDLNRRAQAGRLVGVGQETLQNELEQEATRQVGLQATLSYVQSEDYVKAYAREEGGLLLPGEKRIVPLLVEATPEPPQAPTPTPDPATYARPWQAWWQLLTDAPMPSR